ncbi:acetate/propionate family kinase [Bradyrhizobium sp. 180]|uniref:acetate/propionate family kinase n=1 Tax=unclassified Bradyrhizobium TaxID=2631580 RepID=UPI001FF8855A|nr:MULTISPECIES: acetate/propionate family kinase [unclassified Bradyrhizobium]MCK1423286.1 acetate/propionate family kinase [Bradyrhizobium sp. CW12]MCK1493106.1 acetate/propionate family kinase [Bradyrhizobium sp. 180]MCK1531410.1 acetate/propionate family kinase [Bradyrhizobium sp. 182]MCK1598393.1 acetate/propionate family kinase [Bradyrhizobium sp. 164]MCK1645221.1 acetate/propionate family kinase [Bradyrhizobium sp. 154]
MSDTVLVLNSGSSSIKFGLFELAASGPGLLCNGLLDEHEATPRLVVKRPAGEKLFETRRDASDTDSGHLFADVLTFVDQHFGEHRLRAIGHRIVHGGPDYSGPVALTDDVYAKLEALTPLAPLHQPRCLEPIRIIQATRPGLTQIACFDTAFHHSLSPPARRFAIPRRYEERGVRRYGFHGLSFEYVAGRLAAIAPQLIAKRTVIAHLGNGASLCALHEGRSIDTTMGLTPLDGLVMGTRCGTIDPGVLLYLQQHENMPADDLQHLLYHESGLLGVSGISADMRTLLASSEAAAREAVDLFVLRATQQIVMLATTLGGLDCLIFTGGIGEHAKEIRFAIGERLAWLGMRIDAGANDAARERISRGDSAIEVFIIPTNEELTIARHCAAALQIIEGASD